MGKKHRQILYKLLIPLLLLPIFNVKTVGATPGRLKANSITKVNGVTYGQHGSDNHWHIAEKKNGVWYAKGPEIGSLDNIKDPSSSKSKWYKKGSTWYYYDSNGNNQIGWSRIKNTWYYFSSSGAMQTGWNKIDNKWYYMNSSGAMQTGWRKLGNRWYYMNSSGVMQTGWNKLSNRWYYMNSSGVMQTGWTKIGNTWYYLSGSGTMQTGWKKLNNKWYYLKGSGAMVDSSAKISGKTHTFNKSGVWQGNWEKNRTGWWFKRTNNSYPKNQWQNLDSKWYRFNNRGYMLTGWAKIDSKWYYMNNSGAMQTGWNKIKNKWYFMNSSGVMQTGWNKIKNKTYYMDNSGVMQTGKVNIGGVVYNFDSSGALQNSFPDVPSDGPTTVPDGFEELDDAVIINNHIPYFSNEDLSSTEVYHLNGKLDHLGRVTAANAVVGVEIMPEEERGSISHHIPTGWIQRQYPNIGSGGWLYNRSHLIGYQMTGNNNYNNLMTGTRWFNVRMMEYENWLANYVEQTENHVRYRITPIFEGNNLVASGIYMEGLSIEDFGEGVMFNVFVPNIQPDITINYKDGSSIGPEGPITYEQYEDSLDEEI